MAGEVPKTMNSSGPTTATPAHTSSSSWFFPARGRDGPHRQLESDYLRALKLGSDLTQLCEGGTRLGFFFARLSWSLGCDKMSDLLFGDEGPEGIRNITKSLGRGSFDLAKRLGGKALLCTEDVSEYFLTHTRALACRTYLAQLRKETGETGMAEDRIVPSQRFLDVVAATTRLATARDPRHYASFLDSLGFDSSSSCAFLLLATALPEFLGPVREIASLAEIRGAVSAWASLQSQFRPSDCDIDRLDLLSVASRLPSKRGSCYSSATASMDESRRSRSPEERSTTVVLAGGSPSSSSGASSFNSCSAPARVTKSAPISSMMAASRFVSDRRGPAVAASRTTSSTAASDEEEQEEPGDSSSYSSADPSEFCLSSTAGSGSTTTTPAAIKAALVFREHRGLGEGRSSSSSSREQGLDWDSLGHYFRYALCICQAAATATLDMLKLRPKASSEVFEMLLNGALATPKPTPPASAREIVVLEDELHEPEVVGPASRVDAEGSTSSATARSSWTTSASSSSSSPGMSNKARTRSGVKNTKLTNINCKRSRSYQQQRVEILVSDGWSQSVYEPAFAVCLDHETESIVLTIRGTTGLADVFTDLICLPKPLLKIPEADPNKPFFRGRGAGAGAAEDATEKCGRQSPREEHSKHYVPRDLSYFCGDGWERVEIDQDEDEMRSERTETGANTQSASNPPSSSTPGGKDAPPAPYQFPRPDWKYLHGHYYRPQSHPTGFRLVKTEDCYYVHEGMFHAAQLLSDRVLNLIVSEAKQRRYDVVVTGHSLGGGTAALLYLLWKVAWERIFAATPPPTPSDEVDPSSFTPRLRAYAFACPCVCSPNLSEKYLSDTEDFVSIAERYDAICRLSVRSVEHLRLYLQSLVVAPNNNSMEVDVSRSTAGKTVAPGQAPATPAGADSGLRKRAIGGSSERAAAGRVSKTGASAASSNDDLHGSESKSWARQEGEEKDLWRRLQLRKAEIDQKAPGRILLPAGKSILMLAEGAEPQFVSAYAFDDFLLHPLMFLNHSPASYEHLIARLQQC